MTASLIVTHSLMIFYVWKIKNFGSSSALVIFQNIIYWTISSGYKDLNKHSCEFKSYIADQVVRAKNQSLIHSKS